MRWLISCLALVTFCPLLPAADDPLRLHEKFAAGYQYHVSVRVEVTGTLPDKAVSPGDRWTAARSAIQELTDMERIDDGDVTCKSEGVVERDKRRYARVQFAGTVSGPGEDGSTKQQLDGHLLFDLESN